LGDLLVDADGPAQEVHTVGRQTQQLPGTQPEFCACDHEGFVAGGHRFAHREM